MPSRFVDRSLRGFDVTRGTGLDLNSTFSSRRAEVPGNDDVSVLAKMEVDILFAASAGLLVFGSVLKRERASCEPIQGFDDGAGEAVRRAGMAD
ncbi:MAG TPA: hypothetical protein VJX16_15410 [Terriglobales bacterium]|nr:hypothetical protein [Terriglobales bacterium]